MPLVSMRVTIGSSERKRNGANWPTPKGPWPPVVLKGGNLSQHNAADFLDHIIGVGRLNRVSAEPAAEHRLIQVQEPPPRTLVGSQLEALEQTDGHRSRL